MKKIFFFLLFPIVLFSCKKEDPEIILISESALTVETTEVFSGLSPLTWTELDLSEAVGKNYAWVTIKLNNQSSADGMIALFRQRGDSTEYVMGSDTNNMVLVGANGSGQALVHTDELGVIEWRTNNELSVTTEVVAFID